MSVSEVPTGNTYDKYSTTNALEQRLMGGFFAALDSFLPAKAPARILDVGVGEGVVASDIAGRYTTASTIGVDLPDELLARRWAALDLRCAFADGRCLPFPDASFDLVLAIETLEHVHDPEAALAELARVCSGSIIASVPFEPIWRLGNMLRGRYLRDLGNTPGHINHWSARGFSRFIGRECSVVATARPLPWVMVHARPSERPPEAVGVGPALPSSPNRDH